MRGAARSCADGGSSQGLHSASTDHHGETDRRTDLNPDVSQEDADDDVDAANDKRAHSDLSSHENDIVHPSDVLPDAYVPELVDDRSAQWHLVAVERLDHGQAGRSGGRQQAGQGDHHGRGG